MATPASVFRPAAPGHHAAAPLLLSDSDPLPGDGLPLAVVAPHAAPAPTGAVELELRVPPSGELTLVAGRQQVGVSPSLAGRTLTVWADLRSIHLLLDGHLLRTLGSRLQPQDLAYLAMKGARPARPAPAVVALPRRNGHPTLPAGQAVEVDRKVHRDGEVRLAGATYQVGMALAGRTITLRLDGHLLHAIADGALVGTWPCPLGTDRLAWLPGARAAATPLPPPPLPAGSIRAVRRVHASGRIMVARQSIKLGPRHAGKLVTVVIEDTHFRILHDQELLAVKPRKDSTPITRLYVRGKDTNPR
jgi:hypothetical protein